MTAPRPASQDALPTYAERALRLLSPESLTRLQAMACDISPADELVQAIDDEFSRRAALSAVSQTQPEP